MIDDQADVIAFLSDPASYAEGDAIEKIETHISLIFLCGDRAYKLKRAVKLPYLDFSTARLRATACIAELQLNRRTAPELYLQVKPVWRRADGRVGWDGEVPIDHVVVMVRYPQDCILDEIARKNGLGVPLIHALAAHIAEFHAGAAIHREMGGSVAMQRVATATLDCLQECANAGFGAVEIDALREKWQLELSRLGSLLDQRREAGKIRRCHGDLHLRNICLLDRGPVLFDCLEFSEDLATIDVLYDLAFLLMDLVHRGHRSKANLLLNRYLDSTSEDDGLTEVPFFISLRAAIRAHVSATAARFAANQNAEDEARSYLALAGPVLDRPCPRLIAIGGLSGSGKSTLAARLAPDLGPIPGARILRSDVLRKRRFGVAPETRLPESAYAPDVTGAVYRDLSAKAESALRSGYHVIIDAVALRPEERTAFVDVATVVGVPFTGFWLRAPAPVMAERIRRRSDDASDATTEVLEKQLHNDPGPLDWHRIEAAGDLDATLQAARKALT